MTRSLSLLMVLLGTCGSAAAVAQEVPVYSPAMAETLMKMERDTRCGHILVTALVNGKPMRMLLDTGATHTVIHESSVEKLGKVRWLDTAHVTYQSNAAQRPKIMLGSLLVGPGEAPVHPIAVLNLDAVRNMLSEKIDGVVGMDFLGALPFTFDFRNGQFYWGVSEDAASAVAIPGDMEPSGRVRWLCTCGNSSFKLLLDTGSAITRVPAADWSPGVGEKITAEVGDINSATVQQFSEGKPGDIELAPRIILKGVTPLLGKQGESAVLGLDALKSSVLIHLPTENTPGGAFLICP